MGPSVIGDLLRGVVPEGFDPTTVGPRCLAGCGASVGRRGQECQPCAVAARRKRRADRLAFAYDSLRDWPWCRFGDPTFEERTKAVRHGVDVAREWSTVDRGLVLLGPTGRGKTTLMVAIGLKILDAVRDDDDATREDVDLAAGIRFAHASDIARARRGWPLGKGDPPELTEAMDATLLLLDEMGREPEMDPTMFELFDYRYRKGLPTIATSRLSALEIAKPERYGPDGARRMLKVGTVLDLTPKGIR